MLGPEPLVLDGRQAFDDAQRLYAGSAVRRGFFDVAWYGTSLSDERGSFAVVDPQLALADLVGDILELTYYPPLTRAFEARVVRVYVIGSAQDLGAPLAITRRCYMALEHLATEPINVAVGVIR